MILLYIVFSSSKSYSQKGIEFGVKGNVNSVWIINQNTYGEPELDYETKTGYAFIGSMGYKLSYRFGMNVELGYSSQGQKYHGKQYSSIGDRDITLNYLHLPLLLKFTHGERHTRFHIMTGPQLGYLLTARQVYTRDGVVVDTFINNSMVGKEAITNRYNLIDILYVLDVGADFILTRNYFRNLYINVGIRFNVGLRDINSPNWQINDIDGYYKGSKNFMAGLNIGLNYLFVR